MTHSKRLSFPKQKSCGNGGPGMRQLSLPIQSFQESSTNMNRPFWSWQARCVLVFAGTALENVSLWGLYDLEYSSKPIACLSFENMQVDIAQLNSINSLVYEKQGYTFTNNKLTIKDLDFTITQAMLDEKIFNSSISFVDLQMQQSTQCLEDITYYSR